MVVCTPRSMRATGRRFIHHPVSKLISRSPYATIHRRRYCSVALLLRRLLRVKCWRSSLLDKPTFPWRTGTRWFLVIYEPGLAFFFSVCLPSLSLCGLPLRYFDVPYRESTARFMYSKTTPDTASTCAALASASRAIRPFDPARSQVYLSAALRSWNFLAVHSGTVPPEGFDNPPGCGTGTMPDESVRSALCCALALCCAVLVVAGVYGLYPLACMKLLHLRCVSVAGGGGAVGGGVVACLHPLRGMKVNQLIRCSLCRARGSDNASSSG